MLKTLPPGQALPSAGEAAAPRVLDLLLRGDLMDADVDRAVDTYLADPSLRTGQLHALYRIDFAEIDAAMRASTRRLRPAGGRADRQALVCALLLHRPHLVHPPATAEPSRPAR